MVGDHVAVRAVIVRLHHADEAPFTAEHILKQVCIGTAGLGADPVEGRHHSSGCTGVTLGCNFKGLEINLTDCLLRGECQQEGAAVGLLIVQGKVLDIRVQALSGRTVGLCHGHLATEDTVFGVVLKVTACEGIAVGVHSRAVPAVVVDFLIFLSHCLAHLFDQLGVPGLGHQDFRGICSAVGAGDEVGEACRAVAVGGGNLADRVNLCRLPAAEIDHQGHVIKGQLIEELVPLRVIIGFACEVGKLEAVLCA